MMKRAEPLSTQKIVDAQDVAADTDKHTAAMQEVTKISPGCSVLRNRLALPGFGSVNGAVNAN